MARILGSWPSARARTAPASTSSLRTSSIAVAALPAPFLILLVGHVGGPEVGDRGGHHHRVGVGRVLGHRVAQLRGRTDVHDVDAGRVDEAGGVARDQGHLGAALGGHPGERVALLARDAVAEEAHRVERLPGAARGDDDLTPARSSGSASARSSSSSASVRCPRPRAAGPAPVSAPVSRPDAGSRTMAPRRAQRGDVGDGGRVGPHLGVHRGRDQHRTSGGQQRRGEQVVGAAGGGPGQQVGGGRGDDDQVGLLADPDMRHLGDVGEHAGVHRVARTAPRRSRRRRTSARTRWARRGRGGRPR